MNIYNYNIQIITLINNFLLYILILDLCIYIIYINLILIIIFFCHVKIKYRMQNVPLTGKVKF